MAKNTMNLVMPSNIDEGTSLLRELVADLGGVRPVARLLEVEAQVVSDWTRKGLPRHLWKKVRRLQHENVPSPSIEP